MVLLKCLYLKCIELFIELRFNDVLTFIFPFFCEILKELFCVYVEHEYDIHIRTNNLKVIVNLVK